MMCSTILFQVKMADYTIEPGQNLDLTDPDDPKVEEDGEVVREPEPSDDDSGGGSEPEPSDSGGGGSDPEPDNTGGSSGSDIDQPDTLFVQYRDDNQQYQDRDGDGIPDSLQGGVTVTGGGSSGEPQTVVGTGDGADAVQESQVDAATSEDFRAAEGTDIRRLQERIGNVPGEDNARSVVVTGDPSEGESVKTVGRGETRFQARLEAARNTRFDAAEGTATDYIESLYSQGQGDNTTFQEAFPRNQERQAEPETPQSEADTRFNPRERDIRTFNVDQGAGPTENPAATERQIPLPTPTQPESEAFRRDARGDESDFFFLPGGTGEEALETSIQVQRGAEQAGNFVAGIRDTTLSDLGVTEENVEQVTGVDNAATDLLGEVDEKEIVDYAPVDPQPDSQVTSSFVLFDEGLEATQEEEFDSLDLLAAGSPNIQSPEEREKAAELTGAQIKDAGELLSLVPGAFGAGSEIREDEDLTVTGSLTGGAAIWAEQARENPSEFVTEEVGGEIGTFGAGTVVVPDSFTVPETVDTPARFARGGGSDGLGFRASETRAQINLEETDVLRRGFQDAPGDQQGRVQVVEGRRFTEGGTEVATGTGLRFEEPMTRTQFLKEAISDADKKVAETLEPNAIGSGPGAFLPSDPANTPNTDVQDGGDLGTDDVFIDDTQQPVEVENPETVAVPDAEDEEAFRREEQAVQETEELALFGSPLEPTEDFARGTVSERLTEEVPKEETQQDSFTGLSSTGLEQPSTTDQRPTPPSLDEVTSPEAVLTRATPDTDTDELASGPQLFSTQQTQFTQTEEQTGLTRPLDEDVLDVSRGQTPEFRLPFQHEEEEVVPVQRTRAVAATDLSFGFAQETVPEAETREEVVPDPFARSESAAATPDFGGGRQTDLLGQREDSFDSREDQGVAAPDITSLFFGGGEENVGTESNPATGLERRAPQEEEEEEDFPDAGLF
jgi:hypothetical protein